MQKCKQCGNEFEGKFCNQCGAEYKQQVCSKCGSMVIGKFCSECGTAIEQIEKQIIIEKKILDTDTIAGLSKYVFVKDNHIILQPISSFSHRKETSIPITSVKKIYYLPAEESLFSLKSGYVKFITDLNPGDEYKYLSETDEDPYTILFSGGVNTQFLDWAKNVSNTLLVPFNVIGVIKPKLFSQSYLPSSTTSTNKTFKKTELKAQGLAYCPKCLSTSLSGNKKGFGIGKAIVGAALTGGIGLVAGNIGAKKVRITCLNCGHQFWAGKR